MKAGYAQSKVFCMNKIILFLHLGKYHEWASIYSEKTNESLHFLRLLWVFFLKFATADLSIQTYKHEKSHFEGDFIYKPAFCGENVGLHSRKRRKIFTWNGKDLSFQKEYIYIYIYI